LQVLIILFSVLSFLTCDANLATYLKPALNKHPISTIPKVDYMYVINLDHRKEKFESTVREFAPYHISPYRFSAVNGWNLPTQAVWDLALTFKKGMRPGGMGTVFKNINGKEYLSYEIVEKEGEIYCTHAFTKGVLGCILSHLSVMNDALESNYALVWICEDDIEVVRDPRIITKYIDDLDRIVGRENWDLLFTYRDYRGEGGQYYKAWGAAYRPNIDTRDQERFNIDISISPELKQTGTRFGGHSIIWTREGLKKVLSFYEQYKVFLPYDLDFVLIPNIKMYSVVDDVVTNKLNALTDLGGDSIP
jgi:hypothetical protein